jgi:Carboxypeptidase regulatory-like domain/TonB dependent receptor
VQNMRRPIRLTLAASFLLFMPSLPRVFGQTTSGTILGTVRDASGAVVARASVTITNVSTNIGRTVQTSGVGHYEASALLPGDYEVLVQARGFEGYRRSNISLDARATIRVDATLVLGRAEQKVVVSADVPVITTETPTVSETVEKQSLIDLPLNYRAVDTSPLSTVQTVPGVQVDPSFNISIAGNHPAQNEISMDGFSVVNIRFNGPLSEMLPSTESLSEVKVTSEQGNAEYGGLGDISFVSHGGTNQFHGSLFEYLQNDAFDATPLFAVENPPKHANDFGGSIGGPVVLPFYDGRNKTFFYFDWETNHFHTSDALSEGVPDVPMRSGNFSELCGAYSSSGICTGSGGTQLVNPFSGQPYAYNKLPAVNKVAQNVLNTFYPMPNFDSGDIASNYRTVAAAPVDTDLLDVRIDQKISSKQTIWGRFGWKNDRAINPLGLLQGNESITTSPRSVNLDSTYVIKPDLLNEFRFGYSQERDTFAFDQFPNGAQLVSQTLGLQLPGPFPSGSAIPGFEFDESPLTWTANNRQENRYQHRLQFSDTVSWVHGRHSEKFGADIRRLNLRDFVQFIGADDFGVFPFSGQFTGNDVADFELGLPFQTQIAITGPNFNSHETPFAFFWQDQYQVSQKLTLSYGVRYEVHPPFFDETLQMTNFDPRTASVVVPNQAALALAAPGFLEAINACPGYPGFTTTCTPVITAAQDHLPESLRRTDWSKVLPRIGFAYRVTPALVVRGGFGMYDMTLTGETFYSIVGIDTADVRTYPNSITHGTAAIQFPATTLPGIGAVAAQGTEGFYAAEPFNLKDPYGLQYNLSLERELGKDTGLRVSYVGLRSVQLITNPDLNQIAPQAAPFNASEQPYQNWSVISITENGGESWYNGAEVVLTHRLRAGMTFQSSYTFSKNLSDAEGGAGQSNGGFQGETGNTRLNLYSAKESYGNVSFTRKHYWLTTYTYQLPFGRDKRYGSSMPRALNAVLADWETMGILTLQSGPFLTPYYNGGTDPSGTNAPSRGPQPPDRTCAGTVSNPNANGYFKVACFPIPASNIGRFGDSGVGILQGPGTVSWNAGISKFFVLSERFKLRFQATATDALNHANLAVPDMNAAATTDFGVVHSVQAVQGSTGARTLQLALRLDF